MTEPQAAARPSQGDRAAAVLRAASARAARTELHANGRRRCSKCKVIKVFAEFHRNNDPRFLGYQHTCKDCVRQKHVDHPELLRKRSWVSHLRRKYGLSLDDFGAMLVAQSGVCAICDEQLRDPCVDHDHGTGKVRGLLCNPCNRRVHEGPISWYAAAAAYLEQYPPSIEELA